MKRFGQFSVTRAVLDHLGTDAHLVFKGIFITRCEYNYARQRFEYEGISERFREVPTGEISPIYIGEIDSNFNTEWVEQT